ncbi:MAG: chitobiase/beta-hexosaminidase C-terminal domain-containing protein [Saprospiraceae bacterium]|nr:chitobiase/beta-hexosaminidase C-terminal domain-containing protein [Saprospiraceae bacterium]
MLGYSEPIAWEQTSEGVRIKLPPLHKRPLNTCGKGIWVLRIKGSQETVTEAPQIANASGKNFKNVVFAGSTEVYLQAESSAEIYYTTDGSEPNTNSARYNGKITLNDSKTIRAIAKRPGKLSSEILVVNGIKARYGITLETAYADKYGANGPLSLVDGQHGSTRFTDGMWLGFEGKDCVAILDLGESKPVKAAGMSFLRIIPSWIFLPQSVEIWLSDDGFKYRQTARETLANATNDDGNEVRAISIDLNKTARYVKFIARNQGVCPPWHAGAGAKAWLFVDEVWID